MTDDNIYFHLGYRQTGRTTELIEWLITGSHLGEKRMLLVHSQAEAERVYKLARKWWDERDINCPIESWQVSPVDRKPIGKNIDEVAIDNLELLLYHLTGPYRVTHIYGTKPTITEQVEVPGFIVVEDE